MEKSRDFLTGIVFFGLLAVLGVVTIFLADFSFKPATTVTVAFRDTAGLEVGNDVRVNGVRSGKIHSILALPDQDKIVVRVRFYSDPILYRDATFRIANASALGGQYLGIDRGHASAGRLPMDAEQSGESGSDVLGTATSALARAEEILKENQERIRSLVANLDEFSKVLNDSGKRNLSLLEDTLAATSRVVTRLDEQDVVGRLSGVLTRLESVVTKLDTGDGLLPALLTDASMREDVAGTLASIRRLVVNVGEGKGTVGALLTDVSLRERFLKVVDNLEVLTSPESGFGRFLTDEGPWQRVENILGSVEAAAHRVEVASAGLNDPDTPIGFILNDKETAQKLRRAVDALNRFFETQNENAPLTTFAGLLLKPF